MNNINFFQRLLFCVGCVFLVSVMAPGCDERSTVPLGYGGVYGETPGENACAPSCAFKGCGDDGCGGSCGTFDEGLACQGYACVDADCAAQCDNVVCGADGCGGVCGLCGVNELCEEGLCVLDPNAVIGEPSEEDLDGDGIINGSDNCPEVANLDQADQDADWQGDVCDTDGEGDGFLN